MTTELRQNLRGSRLFEPRLVAALEEGQLLAGEDLARARAAADATNQRLDQALLELGLMSEVALRELIEGAFGVREVRAADLPFAPIAADVLRAEYLTAARVLPVAATPEQLVLAMLDPLDDFAANAIALKSRREVIRRRIAPALLGSALTELYGVHEAGPSDVVDELSGQPSGRDVDTLRDAASDAPVIRFVQDAFRAAVDLGASDIHLRPTRAGASMLFRLHGDLVAQADPSPRLYPSVISRLKILANLDISERRLPQDGRIRANVGGQPIDVRVSTMPHIHGEAAVLRLLSRDLSVSSLPELGFSPDIEAGMNTLFGAADGLILVTGPTGSGKSTTLHAALKQLIRPDLNVVTIEDPVEYRVDGAAQIQVDEKIGLTFPRVLRSLLRQDPDIVLIGEIRDGETAKIAVQAALTGHLVLATLHTNSAPAAIPRLIDMGVEPYLLAAVLRGVLAQRLVRRRCPRCDRDPGCANCRGLGYAGRIAIGELLLTSADLVEALSRQVGGSPETSEWLARAGYRPLREDAERRVAAGEIDSTDLAGLTNAG